MGVYFDVHIDKTYALPKSYEKRYCQTKHLCITMTGMHTET